MDFYKINHIFANVQIRINIFNKIYVFVYIDYLLLLILHLKNSVINETMKSIKDVGSVIEWIDQMTKLISNHGLWKVFKGIIAIGLALLLLNVAFNPEIVFDRFTKYTEQVEKENVEYRRSIDPIIRGELKELVYNSGATRACVMEFHNGTSNFSSLGFLYAAMTYEETKEGVNKISQVYDEVSLSLFNISDIMYKNGYWFGSIDDLSTIDTGLSQTISSSGTKWLAALLLEGSNELGFLILSFDEIPNNPQAIGRDIRRVGVSIASKLDYTNRK